MAALGFFLFMAFLFAVSRGRRGGAINAGRAGMPSDLVSNPAYRRFCGNLSYGDE